MLFSFERAMSTDYAQILRKAVFVDVHLENYTVYIA